MISTRHPPTLWPRFGLSWNSWHWGPKRTVESCPYIDIRSWHRKGLIVLGMLFPWPGRLGHADHLWVTVEETQLLLRYRHKTHGDILERIPMTWTLCHFGGQRPWFHCPRTEGGRRCGRRVAVLYAAGFSFLCRNCCRLAYQSQQQDRLSRLESKIQRIRRRLGGSTDLKEPFPSKPKRMHWRTYERLRQQGEETECALLVAMKEKLQYVQQRMDKLTLRLANLLA